MENKPKVVILCGGLGTRLREETEFKPKSLISVGNRPIIWHVMKIYSNFGFNDFILCLGYKGDMIKEYFMSHEWANHDFTFNIKNKSVILHGDQDTPDWNITFVNTGDNADTGARLKKIEKYIDTDYFLMTYTDGVANVDVNKLIQYHLDKNKIATLTGLRPTSKYGILNVDEERKDFIISFQEKPKMLNDWISGGFFVFNKRIFNYLTNDDSCKLESEPFENLAKDNEFTIYKHDGFWGSMDTLKEMQWLNSLWNSGDVPWENFQ
jgi:glucose-1-phosphate cytidylyltransferase